MQMRVYTSSIETVSTSAAKTLCQLVGGSAVTTVILSAEVVAPDDDTNEQLDICLQRITTPANGTSTLVTAAKAAPGDPTPGAVTRLDYTAEGPTFTADTELGRAGGSSLGGWRFTPTLAEAPVVAPSGAIGLRLLTAPGTAKTLTVRVTWGEIG